MPKKSAPVAPAAPSGLNIRVETDAPVFVSRRRNSGRYDEVVTALQGAGSGKWVVIGPFATALEGLRLMPMRGYKHMREFLGTSLDLEMHLHKLEGGSAVEVWVRTVAAGTSNSNPAGFIE